MCPVKQSARRRKPKTTPIETTAGTNSPRTRSMTKTIELANSTLGSDNNPSSEVHASTTLKRARHVTFVEPEAESSAGQGASRKNARSSKDSHVDVEASGSASETVTKNVSSKVKASASSSQAALNPRSSRTSTTTDIAQREVVCRCAPFELYNITPRLNEQQVAAVNEIGFGGLLALQMKESPRGMIRWLLENFDHESRILRINSCKLSVGADDTFDAFCLPRCPGSDVPFRHRGGKHGESDKVDNQLKDQWKAMYGSIDGDAITIEQLRTQLVSDPSMLTGGEDFKRGFVMFVVSTFLAPMANKTADLKIVRALTD